MTGVSLSEVREQNTLWGISVLWEFGLAALAWDPSALNSRNLKSESRVVS